jgi:exopolysaccharide biosynthesis protein
MLRPLLYTFAVVCACLWPALAHAAELRSVKLTAALYHIDMALEFDTRPEHSVTFKGEPDRYVLTFKQTRSGLSKTRVEELGRLTNRLLTKVTVAPSGAALNLGCYVSAKREPEIKPTPTGYSVRFFTAQPDVKRSPVGPGVELVKKSIPTTRGRIGLSFVQLNGGCPVELYSVAADRYDGKTRLRSPSSFARKEQAEVVINGGFFGAQGQHLSTLVEEGLMRATGVYPTRPMLVVTEDGEVLLGRFNVETTLLFDGRRLRISAKNYPFESGKTIVYDHTYPIDTLPQSGMYYYTLMGGKLKFHAADTKGLALAPGQLLLATDIMPEANPLRQIPDGTDVQLDTRITDEAGAKLTVRSVIGGAPMLVENGARAISNKEDKVRADIAKSERSRTAVGLTRDGSLLLAVVKEAEDEGYGGVTLEVLADLLIAEGAQTAVNLDGGGSSALVVNGEAIDKPENLQRPVSNVLVVQLL